jgi:hypothetical protein
MIAIGQAIGRMIKCPDCGAPSKVSPSKARVGTGPEAIEIKTAAMWMLVECPRTGKKLYPRGTPVEVIDVG